MSGPRVPLTIEAIGDHLRQYGAPPRHWVAELIRPTLDGFERWFLRGNRDYSSANSIGSRRIAVTYMLEDGKYYEISSPQSWGQTERYFARITSGIIEKIERDTARHELHQRNISCRAR